MMAEKSLEQRTISSIIWKLFERGGAQIIQFVVSIILARILMPSDYGAIALIMIFIQIANVFVQGGFSSALIRKLNAEEIDYNSVFWTNLLISIVLYVVLFFCAPVIANFYEMPVLKGVLRVLSLTLILGTYNSIQNVILQKNLQFKKVFINSMVGTIVSAAVGIGMAYGGLGVWALVGQQLSMIVATIVVMQFTVKWHPKFQFSFKRLKNLFSFGWKLLLSGLLEVGYNNIYSLIIGKRYSSTDLGYWNRAKQFPAVIVDNVNGSISSVMYPVLSMKQNNLPEMKSIMRRSLKMSSYLIFPLMVGLAVCAEPIVRLVLTDKWLPCVFFLQMWCIIYAFMPIHIMNLQAYNALGRSDVFLWLEIIKKVLGIVVLFATLPFGLTWMIIGKIISSLISTFINAFPNKKLLNYGFTEQIKDILPAVLLSALMGGVVYGLGYIPINYIAVLAIQVVAGIVIYVLLSELFKVDAYKFIKLKLGKVFSAMITRFKNKKKPTSKQKKVLLLGGSAYILPVIEQIHKLGYKAITCDYIPENIAHKFSDEYYNVSIIDKDAVLELAKKLEIDGIMSFATDPGVVTAGYVAEKMNLPSQGPVKSIEILQDKAKFRQFLKENNFVVPQVFSFDNAEKAINSKNEFPYPIIVKPVDSAGSKGVSRVDNENEILKAVDYAFANSISKKIIIEEFIVKKGNSSDSDCFSVDGKLKFVSFSNQYFDENALNPYTPSAYSWPSSMSQSAQTELTTELQRLLTLLDMKTSLYNVETRESVNGKAYIMEVSPRGGGNKLSEMLFKATDVNLIECAVKAAVGEAVTLPDEYQYKGNYAELILHSKKGGIFKELVIADEVAKNFVLETKLSVNKGDIIEEFSGANKTLGTVALKFETKEQELKYMSDIDSWIEIVVE